jgi:aerobic carbon-monoxide dehydrogenase small subunit
METSLTVNGQPVTVDVEPRTLLVNVLRDQLGLTGAKVGCDTGQCGTCVVHLDGASVKSCAVLAPQAQGSSVTTIEGANAAGEELTALQEALWDKHGVQCGYCTPGLVLSLMDLLATNPQPDEAEIRHWLKGIICRCTGYHSVVRAVQDLVAAAGGTDTAPRPAPTSPTPAN